MNLLNITRLFLVQTPMRREATKKPFHKLPMDFSDLNCMMALFVKRVIRRPEEREHPIFLGSWRLLFSSLLFAILGLPGLSSNYGQTKSLKINAEFHPEQEADYTTTKVYIDETVGTTVPITITFNTGSSGATEAEVWTNLNNRNRATNDINADLIEDGILSPAAPENRPANSSGPYPQDGYFQMHPMIPTGSGIFSLTIPATKTGAYRLTARFRTGGGVWDWYGKRDHAITVSPVQARDIRIYEVNVFNIEASGTQFHQRSTFEDLSDRSGRIHTNPTRFNQWNLDYIAGLGINWLWFQPYHPYGIDKRHESAANINSRDPGAGASTRLNGNEDVNYPYALGSPYAVKNFWEVDPRASAGFSGDPNSLSDLQSSVNRAAAMQSFRDFVFDADQRGIQIMPDAAFNHTAWDVELGPAGIGQNRDGFQFDARTWMAAQNTSGWAATDRIRDRELRVFTRSGDYRLRASYFNTLNDNDIAPAPDRTDFGKWLDVCDIYFGRYAALVGTSSSQDSYKNEGDWIDTTQTAFDGSSGGSFDAYTRATWRYFAQYAPYWLHQTRPLGQNRNSTVSDGDLASRRNWDARGIDGLRCDFGQGLPPQAWEYLINVARSYKWSFVFMAETLDGGEPPYRSNRHFDILNENIIFEIRNKVDGNNPLTTENPITFSTLRQAYEKRRTAFQQGSVLLGTVSHDEDNYTDPWQAVTRYAAHGAIDGAPLIFMGQELGISKIYGFDLFEKNFGKWIPHFKTYNSMMPIWMDTDFGNDQLYHVYAGINRARGKSPALRSSQRWFLDASTPNEQIFSVAKYERSGLSPAQQDVVLAFANLDRNNQQWGNYKIPAGLALVFGLSDTRRYNVKNISAFTNLDSQRDQVFLWGTNGFSGAELKSNGFWVGLKPVPTSAATWTNDPYEAQYLKLYDVTPPPSVASAPSVTPPFSVPGSTTNYTANGSATISWSAANDPEGLAPLYRVTVRKGDNTVISTVETNTTSAMISGLTAGDSYTFTVTALNPHDPNQAATASTASGSIVSLVPSGDDDGDGQSNATELIAGTNPQDATKRFSVDSITRPSANSITITWTPVAGRTYRVEATSSLASPDWLPIATGRTTGSFTENSVSSTARFYRIAVE